MSVVNDDARTSRCVSEKLQSTFWSRSSVKVSVMIGAVTYPFTSQPKAYTTYFSP